MIKIITPLLASTLCFCACTNHHQAMHHDTAEHDVNLAELSKDDSPLSILPTNDELPISLKSGDWQKLDLTYENISNQWRLVAVSDADFNNLNLPIVKKDDFTMTFEKGTEPNNYWVYMPNNCNTMSGKFQLTKTGIKIQDNLPTTEIACQIPPKDLDDDIVHTVILNGNYEIYQKDTQKLLKIAHNQQYWLFIKNTTP